MFVGADLVRMLHSSLRLSAAAILEAPVSDCARLGDVSQSRSQAVDSVRKSLSLKRRDAGAVDQARLESEVREQHGATRKRVNAHAISSLTLQDDHSVCVRKPRCSSGFQASLITVLSQLTRPLRSLFLRIHRCSSTLVLSDGRLMSGPWQFTIASRQRSRVIPT